MAATNKQRLRHNGHRRVIIQSNTSTVLPGVRIDQVKVRVIRLRGLLKNMSHPTIEGGGIFGHFLHSSATSSRRRKQHLLFECA